MSAEPKRRWVFSLRTLFVVVTLFAVGWTAGDFAMVRGFHGNNVLPTIALSAPVSLLATYVGDGGSYYYAMTGGTAVLYAFYGVVCAACGRRGCWCVLGFHLACAAIWTAIWLEQTLR